MVMFKKPTILLNFLAFHTHKTVNEAPIMHQKMAHRDKSVHNLKRYTYSRLAMQNCRQHSNTLFSESG